MSNPGQHKEHRKILKGCLHFDRRSQKALYQMYYAYGMSICIRYSDDRDEAAEILNEGFMKIFTNLQKFDFSKPFKPWLRKILINCSINNYKSKVKRQQETSLEYTNDKDSQENILSGISYQEIIVMIQKLSPAYRTVFNLYVIEGYKHEEIAEMLGISTGTSKSNLAKAKQNLREILKDYFQEDYARGK